MKIAIHQPNYMPWIGYFNKIAKVNQFVFFDDVQFPIGKSFCYRTKILNNGKEMWLSIPVLGKSKKNLIKDTKIDMGINWKKKHLKTLELNYKKSFAFNNVFPIIEEIYKSNSNYLIDYNIPLIIKFSEYLKFKTNFVNSSYILPKSNETGLERIIEILIFLGAKIYFSGSGIGSKRYINENEFEKRNIKLKWQDFKFKKYKQLKNRHFIQGLSIIDLLFNYGPDSKKYI